MKKLFLTLFIAVILQSLFVGVAGAEYSKENDETISVHTGQNVNIPLNTGETSFELQEAFHNYLKLSTDLEVDHYYYWVELDGQKILAVDPIRPMY